jgi:hypothetical protein
MLRHALAVVLFLTLPACAAADEAQQADGARVPGVLQLEKGRIQFRARENGAILSGDRLGLVRFDGSAPSWRTGGAVRVSLLDGQRLTGVLIGLDRETLKLSTQWADRLSLPRAAVASIAHLPGWQPLADDDFRDGAKHWSVTGKPELSDADDHGARTVRLSEGGQSLTFTPSSPVDAGRVGINFQERDTPSGARWQFEALFGAKGKERLLRVTLAGAGDAYEVEAPDFKGTRHVVARSAGWHRLTLRFSAAAMSLSCDDLLLWHTLEQGPGGPLRQVRLVCVADRGKPRGGVEWAEFSLARAVAEARHPPGDAAQDEVWTADGDQLFGEVVAADRRGVELHGRFGKRSFSWTAVRGCFLRRGTPAATSTSGAQVRIGLATGLTTDEDTLDGVLTGLDEKRWSLRHPLLGELSLERARVRWLRPLFHGKRIEVDNGFHHLGDTGRLMPELSIARAEGANWRGTFRLSETPASARLVVILMRPKDRRAAGQTRLILNGRPLDALDGDGRLTVSLPRALLREGENVVELRQPRGHVGVEGVVVECRE